MMRAQLSAAVSLMVLLAVSTSALAQRSSPQFSFPPPGPVPDVFTSANGQDLGLLQAQPQLPAQPQLVPLGAQSAFSAANVADPNLLVNQAPQLIAQSSSILQPANTLSQAAAAIRQQQQEQQQQSSNIERSPVQSQSSQARPSLSLSSLSSQQSHQQQQPQQQQQQQQQHQHQQQHSQASGQQQSASSSRGAQAQSQSQSSSSQSSRAREPAASSHQRSQVVSVSQQNANHHQHNHQHVQQQSATQTANAEKSKEAAIEAARRAEATAASLAAASGQSYQCPDSFGYFRHHKSCDKYYACENGTATLKLCGNGLMFDDSDPKRENCAYPFSVDCGSDRVDLEPPISTPHCPRLYGLFADPTNCRVFYSCWNGESSKYECPPGLAYDNEQRVCVWADLVDRCDQSEVSDGFVCPDPTEVDQPGHYTRHAHPTDCRKFYVCIEGVARPYGCSLGTVFNVDSLQCDEPENVSGCEKYYGDMDPKTAKKLAREGTSNHNSASPSRSTSGSQGSGSQSGSSNSQANH